MQSTFSAVSTGQESVTYEEEDEDEDGDGVGGREDEFPLSPGAAQSL